MYIVLNKTKAKVLFKALTLDVVCGLSYIESPINDEIYIGSFNEVKDWLMFDNQKLVGFYKSLTTESLGKVTRSELISKIILLIDKMENLTPNKVYLECQCEYVKSQRLLKNTNAFKFTENAFVPIEHHSV